MLVGALALAAVAGLASAQAPAQPPGQGVYPSKPVRLAVPFAAGSALDRVVKSAHDRHTLLLSGDAALVLTGGTYGVKPPYDTLRDLTPIAQLIVTPNVLVVANDVPARNVQELVALVRSHPGKFSYGSGGIGFSTHRAGELMNSMAGLDMCMCPTPATHGQT